MTSLKWQLSYALGYAQLEMFSEAEAELMGIPVDKRHLPEVLAVAVDVYQSSGNWQALHLSALALIDVCPENPGGWISAAYGLRRTQGLQAARELLLQGALVHTEEPTIQFNLGCYAAQLGELDLAELHVRRAIELNPAFKKMAQQDEDLEPLRASGISFA